MKNTLKGLAALGLFAIITACGSGNNAATTTGAASCAAGTSWNGSSCVAATQTAYTTCTVAGTVSTQYGCVQQVYNPSCNQTTQTFYNNTCVSILTATTQYGTACTTPNTVSTQYGCVPQVYNASCNQTTQTFYNNTCVNITYTGTNTYPNGGGYYPGQNGQNGQCPAGTFNTTFGCLSQANCQPGWVSYQNQCFILVPMGGQGYGQGYGGGGFGFNFHLGY